MMITMIGVAVQRPGDGLAETTRQTSFVNGFTAVTNIVFAYCMFHSVRYQRRH